MYTVMAAAMDKRVIAVDPILNNLALINQSLKRSKKTQHVSFIRNPIRFYSPRSYLVHVITLLSLATRWSACTP